jgi:hypothetical protein
MQLLVRRIEGRLYTVARSYEEYVDPLTLIKRLELLFKGLLTGVSNMQKAINHRLGIDSQQGNNDYAFNLENVMNSDVLPSFKNNQESERMAMESEKGKVLTAAQRPNNFNYHAYFTGSIRHHPKGLQVSSQGCSRVFIVKVLLKVSDYVQGKNLPSIFTFKRELVLGWLEEAKAACSDLNYDAEEAYYGGPPFVENDLSTYWSEPHQLYTWWKNNVERRTKYKIIQDDSLYVGNDPRRVARARWCQVIVTLSEIIRSSSGSSVAAIVRQKAQEEKVKKTKERANKKRKKGESDEEEQEELEEDEDSDSEDLPDDGEEKVKKGRKKNFDTSADDAVIFEAVDSRPKRKPGRKKGWTKAKQAEDSDSFADDFDETSDSEDDEEINVTHRLIPKPDKKKQTKPKEKSKLKEKVVAPPPLPKIPLSKFAEAAVSLPTATLKLGATHFTKNLKAVLTELGDEDFLDLTLPKTKRIFIDINDTVKNDNSDTNNNNYYYAGPCYGTFYPKGKVIYSS